MYVTSYKNGFASGFFTHPTIPCSPTKGLHMLIVSKLWRCACPDYYLLLLACLFEGLIDINLCSGKRSPYMHGKVLNIECTTCPVPWVLLNGFIPSSSPNNTFFHFLLNICSPPCNPCYRLYSVVDNPAEHLIYITYRTAEIHELNNYQVLSNIVPPSIRFEK